MPAVYVKKGEVVSKQLPRHPVVRHLVPTPPSPKPPPPPAAHHLAATILQRPPFCHVRFQGGAHQLQCLALGRHMGFLACESSRSIDCEGGVA